MQPQDNLPDLWNDLAQLIDALSMEEQARFLSGIRRMVHDLRQNVSIIYSAESLLRRSIPDTQDNRELLESIRTANQRTIRLVTELAQPFDREITLPAQKLPSQPVKKRQPNAHKPPLDPPAKVDQTAQA